MWPGSTAPSNLTCMPGGASLHPSVLPPPHPEGCGGQLQTQIPSFCSEGDGEAGTGPPGKAMCVWDSLGTGFWSHFYLLISWGAPEPTQSHLTARRLSFKGQLAFCACLYVQSWGTARGIKQPFYFGQTYCKEVLNFGENIHCLLFSPSWVERASLEKMPTLSKHTRRDAASALELHTPRGKGVPTSDVDKTRGVWNPGAEKAPEKGHLGYALRHG